MGRDNKDRYGNRHRDDTAYSIGESAPGTVGDSDGTFHDRARQDENIIVDGKAKNYQSHKRSTNTSGNTTEEKTQTQQDHTQKSDLNGNVIEVTVDRISGRGNAIASYHGQTIHVEDGAPGKTYRVELERQPGYFLGTRIQVSE